MIDYYIELMKIFKIQEIFAHKYEGEDLPWLRAKYFHSLRVVETGENIMDKEPVLKRAPQKVKQDMVLSLLMHDCARSYEKQNGYFAYHGAEGAHMLLTKYHLFSPIVLSAVLLHDQMDTDLLTQNDADLNKNARFLSLRDPVKLSVKHIRKLYQESSKTDRFWIDRTCALVKDADTLANLNDYEMMFPLTQEAKTPLVSPLVLLAIENHDYVNYKDVKTLPDRAMAYLGWVYHFSYPATIQLAKEKNLFQGIKNYVLSQTRQAGQSQDLLERQFNAVLSSFEIVLDNKIKCASSKMQPLLLKNAFSHTMS